MVPIVRSHHEKWDGSGYPDGLRGEEIPVGARILSAVDCLDALASNRQYRRALPLEEAMQFLVQQSGKAYDPQVVALLQRHYVELEEMTRGMARAEAYRLIASYVRNEIVNLRDRTRVPFDARAVREQWRAERQRGGDQADKTLASLLSAIVTHVGFLGWVVQDLADDVDRAFSTVDDALLLLRRR